MSVNRLRRLIRRSATPGEPATTRRQNDDRKSQVGGGALLCSVLLGAEGGEEDYVADRGGVGQEHHEAVHADAQAGRGGPAVLEGAEVVLVDDHRLGVARRLLLGLVLEPRSAEHTSELQSLMRISSDVFCLK